MWGSWRQRIPGALCSALVFQIAHLIAGIGFDQKGYIIANKEAIKVV